MRSARAGLGADRVGFSIEALENDPVADHPVDQISAGDRSIGEVFGPDEAAELGEVVVEGLAGHIGVAPRDRPEPSLDLLGAAVVGVVQDEVHQELVDDPSVVALAHPRDLDRPHDVDPGGLLERSAVRHPPAARPPRVAGPSRRRAG